MSQRTRAGLLALPLVGALWLVAAFSGLPYVTYSPGPTVDILAEKDGREIVQVEGHKTYQDDGELRLTTIYVDAPEDRVGLLELMGAWFNPDAAVYPRDAVYGPQETDESNDRESSVAMVSSQDAATAAALTELGYDVEPVVEVLDVQDDMPADGKLEVRDVLLRVGSTKISTAQDVVDAVVGAPEGEPIDFRIRRGERVRTVAITPTDVDGAPRIGITPGPGFTFPFAVSVDIGPSIGGPSAGLMFSLAILDTLTPGPLTGGGSVAGTGTIQPDGSVGPIGGIAQKIAGARNTGADLFLVPADNCDAVVGVDPEEMRLAAVSTMHEAVTAVEEWAGDPDADLPTCEDVA